jgi:hypothetical protein
MIADPKEHPINLVHPRATAILHEEHLVVHARLIVYYDAMRSIV